MADLCVLVPLASSLILVNGLDPGAVLIGAGLFPQSRGKGPDRPGSYSASSNTSS